jgi:two-component system chemotaxis response regulator CheB
MNHDIVVVGGSAGAIGVLKHLVRDLPKKFPAALLVVQHIPPNCPSQLAAILAQASPLPAKAAEDGESVRAGHIYVAPPDRHLLVESDRLRVTRGPKENRSRPAIDALFRSAAYSCGPRVIGIVLSGSLDDGTAGLWAIKDRGGITVVQNPTDAEHPSMPQSAMDHSTIDHVVAGHELTQLLNRITSDGSRAVTRVEAAKAMEIETRIALEGYALREGIMNLGPVSPNTCPECHGVLVRIQEGRIVRFRCHTGHAYSVETLLAEVNDEIDSSLWGTLRAIEERIMLLREMERLALARNDAAAARSHDTEAEATAKHVRVLRELVLDHQLFHTPK